VRKSSLAIGVGVLGMFSSFMGLANQAPEIRYSPWFLPLNILEEGAMAPGDEPLSNATVFAISLIGSAVLSVGAAVLMTRRDVP
jgi:hypothetical protein